MSKTEVVNLKHDPYDVYIGRAGRGEVGYFGNPIRINQECVRCGQWHTPLGDTIPCYKAYFIKRITEDEEFRRRVAALKGKRLGCFCKPGNCHGDVIVSYLDNVRTYNNSGLPNPEGAAGEGTITPAQRSCFEEETRQRELKKALAAERARIVFGLRWLAKYEEAQLDWPECCHVCETLESVAQMLEEGSDDG